jgi:hypothetical protein
MNSVENFKFSKYIFVKTFVLYLLVLCLGGFSVFVFVKGIKAQKEYSYVYTENNNVDYAVYLKDNDYFEEKYLGKGKKYIASLIDYINVSFDYKLSGNEVVNGKYNYTITATLEAKEKGKDVVVWSKDEVLFENKDVDISAQSDYSISSDVKIDYSKYNTIMQEFRSAYGISVDGELIVSLRVNSNINTQNNPEDMDLVSESTVSIPLTEQMIEIEADYTEVNNETKTITYKETTWIHYLLMVCGVILFIYYLYLSYRLLVLIRDILKNQDKYQRCLSKIFSNYGNIIVKLKKLPKINNEEVMDVENFDELLDAQSELREPILYTEVISGQESCFIIIKENRVFRHKIKYTDFAK